MVVPPKLLPPQQLAVDSQSHKQRRECGQRPDDAVEIRPQVFRPCLLAPPGVPGRAGWAGHGLKLIAALHQDGKIANTDAKRILLRCMDGFCFSFLSPRGRRPQFIMVHHARLSASSSSARGIRHHQFPTGLEEASTSLAASGKAAGTEGGSVTWDALPLAALPGCKCPLPANCSQVSVRRMAPALGVAGSGGGGSPPDPQFVRGGASCEIHHPTAR